MFDLHERVPVQGDRKGERMIWMVYVTCKNVKEAESMGRTVVKERLAACANIFPEVRSIYCWEGNAEVSKEAVLILKTKEELVERLMERIKEIRPYNVPCILAIPIEKSNPSFLEWVKEVME